MTLHLSTATVWIQLHATVAVGSFEMLACFHLYMYKYLCFWKAVCLQHHSLTPSQREESRLKVTVVWRLFLDNQRKFRSDCSWQSGPYPPASVRGLSPTTGWVKQPALLFHFTTFFSLVDSVLTNSFPLLLFFLYPHTHTHPLCLAPSLCPLSPLSMCTCGRAEAALTDRNTDWRKQAVLAGREMMSCWAPPWAPSSFTPLETCHRGQQTPHPSQRWTSLPPHPTPLPLSTRHEV